MGEPGAPILDRSGTNWRGSVPGIGAFQVDADGAVRVQPVGPDPDGTAERALRHGWGELIAQVRIGRSLTLGAALAPTPEGALLVAGDAHDVAAIALALSAREWLLISDRPTPVWWEDDRLVASPRPAPLVLARQRAIEAGVAYTNIRSGSNAVAVDVPRLEADVPVAGLLLVQPRRPEEDKFTELVGQRRFERAANLMLGGVLAPERSQDDILAEHLRLAALPSAVVRITGAADIDEVLSWWPG